MLETGKIINAGGKGMPGTGYMKIRNQKKTSGGSKTAARSKKLTVDEFIQKKTEEGGQLALNPP